MLYITGLQVTDNLAYAAGFDCFVNAPAGTVRLWFRDLVHRVAVLEIHVGPSELGFVIVVGCRADNWQQRILGFRRTGGLY